MPPILGSAALLAGAGIFVECYRVTPTDPALGRAMFALALVATAIGGYLLAAPSGGARKTLLTVIGFALLLSLPKVLRTPHAFTFYDELQHVRSTEDILGGGSIFTPNTINPLLEHYPGLHVVTAMIVRATGFSIHSSGAVLTIAARAAMLVSLLELYRRLTGSRAVAVTAVLIYCANPGFLFFDAQFAYESLSLPLMTVALLLAFVAGDSPATSNRGRTPLALVLAIALVSAAVVMHHISIYSMSVLMLLTAACIALAERGNARLAWSLAGVGAFGAAAGAAWASLVAHGTWGYLSGDIGSTLQTVPDFFTGHHAARKPFSGSPFHVPLWERAASYGGVAATGIAFVWGALRVLRRPDAQRGRWIAFALVGASYFLSLPLQLLQDPGSAPIASRIWEVSFIGLAPVAALAVNALRVRRLGGIVAIAGLSLALLAGAVLRSGENIRLPGPYIASAGPRAVSNASLDAAMWFERHYGPHRKVMGDVTMVSVFGAYARAYPVTYQNFGYRPWQVFGGPTVDSRGTYELARSQTRFIIIDRRVLGSKRFGDFYFASAEPHKQWKTFPQQDLDKFAQDQRFTLVYEHDGIEIYRYAAGRVAQ